MVTSVIYHVQQTRRWLYDMDSLGGGSPAVWKKMDSEVAQLLQQQPSRLCIAAICAICASRAHSRTSHVTTRICNSLVTT